MKIKHHSYIFYILALAVILINCGTYIPKVRDFVPKDNRVLTDSQLLKPNTRGLPELFPLNTGEIEVDTSLLLNLEKDPSLKNTKVYVPVMSYLVRHPEKGDVLIDTGFDDSFSKSGHGNFGCMAKFFSFAKQKPGQDIANLLKSMNAKVTGVYFTHLHADHTTGVPALSKDIPYYAGKGSLSDSYADLFGVCMNHLDGINEIQEINFESAANVDLLGKVIDVWGDGSLWAIHTPGHSEGHISFLVNSKSGSTLLTGDASHTSYGFKNSIAPGKTQNKKKSEESLEKLIAFNKRNPQVKVIFGHDPENSYTPEKK